MIREVTKNIWFTPSIKRLLAITLPDPHINAAQNIAPIVLAREGCSILFLSDILAVA